MTLIEMIIVLAIIGFAMSLAFMAIRHVRKTSLRQDVNSLAAVMRAARNMAQLSGMNHRVVIDLDQQVYRIEQCPGDVRLEKTDDRQRRDQRDRARSRTEPVVPADSNLPPDLLQSIDPAQAARLAAALSGQPVGSGADTECQVPTLPNGDADGRGNERSFNTDDDIKVRRVFVQHDEDAVLDGTVTVYFFPLGNAEKAMVVVADDDGNAYSVLVHPFTGRVEIRQGEADVDEFMHRDALGNKVDER